MKKSLEVIMENIEATIDRCQKDMEKGREILYRYSTKGIYNSNPSGAFHAMENISRAEAVISEFENLKSLVLYFLHENDDKNREGR